MPQDPVAALEHLYAVRDAAVEARQIVRDGLRARGLMPAALPPRQSQEGRHLRAGRWHYVMVMPGSGGEYRMTPGDLPGENGLPA